MSFAHTNTVGFLLSNTSETDCTSGPDGECYNVEIFYGTWHSSSVAPEGHLAIFRIEGGSETQVVGQSAPGGTAIPFSTSHSKTGTLPNGLSGSPNYSTIGTYYDRLQTVFTLGSNYFYSCGGGLYGTLAACPSAPLGTYSHQSAVAPALGPGTYRIDYDAATKGSLSATWTPDGPINTAVFTISAGGGVIVSDGEQPVVALAGPSAPVEGPFTVTATFNEDVTGFDLGDVLVSNGAASDFIATSATDYAFTVTPDGSTRTIVVEVPANSAIDSGSNGNARSNLLSVLVREEIPPQVTLTGPSGTQTSPFTVTATFDEPVTGFELSDLVVTNASASDFNVASSTIYTLTITPDGSGLGITVHVPAGVAQDAQDNLNVASNQFFSGPDDTTPPSLILTGPTEPQDGPFTVTATFSEDVTGFEIGDISVSEGSASNLTQLDASTYAFTVTPNGTGRAITVDVADDVAQDAAANGNTAASQFAIGPFDTNGPSLMLTGPTSPQDGAFTITATFSEDVTGFEDGDITVMGGTLSNFITLSPSTYAFDVTPDGSQDLIQVSVADGMASDSADNPNSGSSFAIALSPMFHFDEAKEELQELVRTEAIRDLRNSMRISRRMVKDARARMIGFSDQHTCLEEGRDVHEYDENLQFDCDQPVTKGHVPFDMDGSAGVSGPTAFLRGSFFAASGGDLNRLAFGEFDITSYDGGTVTGTLSGRIAWEAMVSPHTLRGIYLGADLIRSDISGAFSGSRGTVTAGLGAYVVHSPRKNLFFDGYASVGLGRNNLQVADTSLSVDGDYTTRSAQFGGAISGILHFTRFEVHPELSFAYGHTEISDGTFDAKSGGMSMPAILEGGPVAIGQLRFEPEFVVPITFEGPSYDIASLSIAPSLICEQIKSGTKSTDCGGGIALSYSANSVDGLRSLRAELRYEETHGVKRKSLNLRLEHAF